ncbi:DUF4179 domain-containing protein [Acutalibacter sp. JLR.KK004]|uniref:DUF4179 domain-containing protein n=1 Tax=Acutalibacter sp. JLR.KK004 TaxID=3112622 RepID=UPI002FF1A265
MKHLQRGNEETRRLLKELEIPAVPAAVENRLRRIYAELPGEMPQTYEGPVYGAEDDFVEVTPFEVKPMHRAVRGLLGACGAMAAAMVLLMGLNTVNPGFTESLPGLGGLFAQINGKNPMGTNLDTYDDLEQVSQVALAEQDSGYKLTVDEAFCDGNYVYFTLEMECPESAAEYEAIFPYDRAGSLSQEDEPYAPARYTINGTVTGVESSGLTGSPAEGKIGLAYALPVHGGEMPENGEKVTVEMSIPALEAHYGKGHEKYATPDYIPVGFEAEFEVTVNTSHNHISVGEGQDNGVSVKEVESTPGYIKIKIESPMWGYEGEEMYHFGIVKGIPNECFLYTEDGQELARNSNFWEEDPKLAGAKQGEHDWPKKGEMLEHTLGFNGAPADCKKVKLRIFDNSLFNWQYDSQGAPKPKLFTELTIDLETGEAVPSDTYLADGFEKIDVEEYINTQHTPDITGGYMMGSGGIEPYRYVDRHSYGADAETDLNGWTYQADLYCGVDDPDLELRFYRGGELLGTMSTPAMDKWEKTEYGTYHYTDENGRDLYMRDCADLRETMQFMEYPAGPKWAISFRFYVDEPVDPQWTAENNQFTDRIEVVKKSTGEVLADNPNGYEVFGNVKSQAN